MVKLGWNNIIWPHCLHLAFTPSHFSIIPSSFSMLRLWIRIQNTLDARRLWLSIRFSCLCILGTCTMGVRFVGRSLFHRILVINGLVTFRAVISIISSLDVQIITVACWTFHTLWLRRGYIQICVQRTQLRLMSSFPTVFSRMILRISGIICFRMCPITLTAFCPWANRRWAFL